MHVHAHTHACTHAIRARRGGPERCLHGGGGAASGGAGILLALHKAALERIRLHHGAHVCTSACARLQLRVRVRRVHIRLAAVGSTRAFSCVRAWGVQTPGGGEARVRYALSRPPTSSPTPVCLLQHNAPTRTPPHVHTPRWRWATRRSSPPARAIRAASARCGPCARFGHCAPSRASSPVGPPARPPPWTPPPPPKSTSRAGQTSRSVPSPPSPSFLPGRPGRWQGESYP